MNAGEIEKGVTAIVAEVTELDEKEIWDKKRCKFL